MKAQASRIHLCDGRAGVCTRLPVRGSGYHEVGARCDQHVGDKVSVHVALFVHLGGRKFVEESLP